MRPLRRGRGAPPGPGGWVRRRVRCPHCPATARRRRPDRGRRPAGPASVVAGSVTRAPSVAAGARGARRRAVAGAFRGEGIAGAAPAGVGGQQVVLACVAHGLTLAAVRRALAPGAAVVSGCGRGADSIPGGLGTCRDDLPPELPPSMLEYPAVKSAVETLNPTRVKLTVEVPFEELKPSLDAAYKTIASQITVPGFRKGKVPAADHRPARRPRRGAAGGRQRGPAALLRPGRRGERGPPARPARGRRDRRARPRTART